ncbi:cobalamin biosynthesis protein [Rhodobacteraceae bacterium F11138]|nr:cobalamin biosynthesis protein [Rhodobacteraceae bacterium F11138]
MSTALSLMLALLLDAALGEPRWLWSRLPHPAVLMGRLVAALDRSLNRGAVQRLGGLAAVLLLGFVAIVLGYALSALGPLVEIPCVAILLAQRSLVQHVQAVADALRLSTGDARLAVAMIVSRDCETMGRAQIARSTIESAAENLSDGVIAPAFWFLVAGLPGMVLYKAINTADSMIGYRNERYARFGWAAARLDDVLNLIPARLTAGMIAILSGRLAAWPEIRHDARQHRSPNAGWPEAAMARALNLALAGPRSYDGRMRDLAWVNGSARRDIGAEDIEATVRMLWKVWWLSLVAVTAWALLF